MIDPFLNLAQATDLQEATKRQACNVEANVESSGQEQCHEFFLDWQRVHFQSLAQQGLLNLPIAENCNWESGNLKALQSQAEVQLPSLLNAYVSYLYGFPIAASMQFL